MELTQRAPRQPKEGESKHGLLARSSDTAGAEAAERIQKQTVGFLPLSQHFSLA